MGFEFSDKVLGYVKNAIDKNEEAIKVLAEKLAENIETDHILHTFGTGHSHMVSIELFSIAGGLGNVNAILDPDVLTANGARRSGALERTPGVADVVFDSYKFEKGDMMFITSNSGRNAMPIEMAMRCKKEDVYTVAFTNLEQSKNATSRHSSGKKLYECVDMIIDTCVPDGDAMMDIGGIKTGPASSIITLTLVDTIITEAIRIVVSHGKKPYVFQSQNVDGSDNEAIYRKFENRCKHL